MGKNHIYFMIFVWLEFWWDHKNINWMKYHLGILTTFHLSWWHPSKTKNHFSYWKTNLWLLCVHVVHFGRSWKTQIYAWNYRYNISYVAGSENWMLVSCFKWNLHLTGMTLIFILKKLSFCKDMLATCNSNENSLCFFYTKGIFL